METNLILLHVCRQSCPDEGACLFQFFKAFFSVPQCNTEALATQNNRRSEGTVETRFLQNNTGRVLWSCTTPIKELALS